MLGFVVVYKRFLLFLKLRKERVEDYIFEHSAQVYEVLRQKEDLKIHEKLFVCFCAYYIACDKLENLIICVESNKS